jgi:3-oxoacyl-[acyl-carrier protein] reductase
MDLNLTDRVAVVTGASKGIGLAVTRTLLDEGARVVATSRNRTPELDGLSGELLHVPADLMDPDAPAEVIARAVEAFGGLDILVNNAGGPPPGDFRNWTRDDWIRALDANMLTPIELIKATMDGMIARRFGRVVNITSSAVKAPIDILGLSNGARTGLTGFVAGLARNVARHNVTINNLLPGSFDTDRLRSNLELRARKAGASVEDVRAQQLAAHPAGRFGTADEFGAACAFLCSAQAGYIVGQNLLIDGGQYPGTF